MFIYVELNGGMRLAGNVRPATTSGGVQHHAACARGVHLQFWIWNASNGVQGPQLPGDLAAAAESDPDLAAETPGLGSADMRTATGATGASRGERDGGLEARGESETDGADQRQGAGDQSHQAEVRRRPRRGRAAAAAADTVDGARGRCVRRRTGGTDMA